MPPRPVHDPRGVGDDAPEHRDTWELWGWPWACAGLVVIDTWLIDLGLWWFGWWPA